MNRCTTHQHAYSCNRPARDALYRFAVARCALYVAAIAAADQDTFCSGDVHRARLERRRLARTLGTLKVPLDLVADWYAEQTTEKAAYQMFGAIGFTEAEEIEWHQARRNTSEWKWGRRCASQGTSFWCGGNDHAVPVRHCAVSA